MKKPLFLHNPRCRKSREALALLNQKGLDVEVRAYLEDPLNQAELNMLFERLDDNALPHLRSAAAGAPGGCVRTGEKEYKENYKGKNLTRDEWIAALIKFPKLLERPILITEDKAAVGRPPENLLNIL